MKIRNIRIKKFKRFTDFQVMNIPAETRLVVIAGPNGCGKSSFFEALNVWFRTKIKGNGVNWDPAYYVKSIAAADDADVAVMRQNVTQAVQRGIDVELHDSIPTEQDDRKKAFYARSAYRNDPAFQVTSLNRLGVVSQDVVQQVVEPIGWRLLGESIVRSGGVVPVEIALEIEISAVR